MILLRVAALTAAFAFSVDMFTFSMILIARLL
jgi:hypothetical protein